MKFFDRVSIQIASGKGGDGIVAARREAGVPYGGPAGGNGGRGGDVIFVASKDVNTLAVYQYKHHYSAAAGEPGRTKDQYGKDGEDVKLTVPVGTVFIDEVSGRIVHQLLSDGEEWVALAGGEGGVGNMHFATSVLQFPEYAVLGEPGQELHLVLELQLLADVALIGTPSVGKSSLINVCSRAKAQVAAYHFTTLVPNLGMVQHRGTDFSMIDIPGLIEGASSGKGLGNEFLRHVLKAHVLCFVQDLSQYEAGMGDTLVLLEELVTYVERHYVGSTLLGQELSAVRFELAVVGEQLHLLVHGSFVGGEERLLLDKMLLFVLNKYDLIMDGEIVSEYQRAFWEQLIVFVQERFDLAIDTALLSENTLVVSAGTRFGVDHFLDVMAYKLRDYDFVNDAAISVVERDGQDDKNKDVLVDITQEEMPVLVEQGYVEAGDRDFVRVWLLDEPLVRKWVYQAMRTHEQGEQWFWSKCKGIGLLDLAHDVGVRYGDVIKIEPGVYNDVDVRYVRREG